ncbi:Hpt domain-containing protein [Tumidithrix elongata RA019]|uniref:Hpt domain-containing protein n=1 Tax=Tumidithrix elongata BACA0141 TaxID=2716417 RepID=A0AAW9Q1P2_9CYAN|nr:Hpt domain-containing protein [Tumidithrix elongata RA019]
MNNDTVNDENDSSPVLDRSFLQEIFALAGAEPEAFLVEMIDCYLEATPNLIEAIQNAIADSDLNALQRAAHTLKSNSVSVGACGLANYCQQLEAIDKSDSIKSQAKVLLQEMEIQYLETKEALLIERQRYQP